MVEHNIAPHSQIISQRGKTGKGNPKDDFKNTVINVFAPVRKSALLNFRAGNGKLNCFLRPAGVLFCKIKTHICDVSFQGDCRYHARSCCPRNLCLMCVYNVYDYILLGISTHT